MIPPEKMAAVVRGLEQAFGVTAMEDICPLTSGLSSDLVFRILVGESPYLLRIMTRIDERMDPVRIFACMNSAAVAGLTPCVRYSNAEEGISITDFVAAVAFPATQALIQLPVTLRKLHALPPFPKTFNYATAHNFFIWRFRQAPLLPKCEIEEIFLRYDRLCATYPLAGSDMVSCHSDLKPENILFDGQRVWLVNWQAAFVNDRYFDLAVAANFIVTNDADERSYLEQYFGQPADDYQRAKFFLMRQVLHMFSAAVFLLLGSGGKPVSRTENLPLFEDFHRRIWAGEVNLAENHQKILYGLVHWGRLRQNVRQARFDEAIRIVAARNAAEGAPPLLPAAPF